jgi:GDPmannose 4,6-dehydratase
MRKAIIFGVTGQDGSHLADFLLAKDYKVVGVARRTSQPSTQNIESCIWNEDSFKLVQGDVTDPMSVYRVIRDNTALHDDDMWLDESDDSSLVTEIYNLAAQSHVKVSFDEPIHTTDVTYKGCLNILEAIRTMRLENYCRFYQASSSEMFGSSFQWRGKEGMFEQVHPSQWMYHHSPYQDENTPFLPNSPYAIAKLGAHHAVRMYREAYKLHASSGILFNHEGERRGDDFVTQKIAKWAAECKTTYDALRCVEVYLKYLPELTLGNMDASRDWGYAPDYVEAMWLMLQQEKPDDYVVATGETHTVREFVEAACEYIGVSVNDVKILTDNSLLRPSEVPYLRGDASKAKRVLGWEPKTKFKEMVGKMVQYQIDLLTHG